MSELAAVLQRARILPVLTITDAGLAVPLARALCAGGLTVLEVTLRTGAALDAARAIMTEVPEATIGLGTVLSSRDIDRAMKLGARFAVSPGATPDLLRAAAAAGLPFLPGVATASEAMRAMESGFSVLKFFPAEAVGGAAALASMAAPLPDLAFCPTGGIDSGNLGGYLALPNVVAVGGSWLVPPEDVQAGAWSRITERASKARRRAGR